MKLCCFLISLGLGKTRRCIGVVSENSFRSIRSFDDAQVVKCNEKLQNYN